MGFRTSRWMPGRRRENGVQKMLVMKQMMQVVEWRCSARSRIDGWRQHARAQAGGRGARSPCCGTGGGVFVGASRQRAGAFGLSAGVAMDLRLGWDMRQRADQVEAEKRLSDEKPHVLIFFESHVLVYLSTATRQARRVGEQRERANVIWSLHAAYKDFKSSEVDAFSLSIPWRRRSRA